jgi:WD40 repeat protein
VSGSDDGSLLVWDCKREKLIAELKEHKHGILCLLLLDSTTLVTGSVDKTLKLWNLETLECFETFSGHQGRISCMTLLQGIRKSFIVGSEVPISPRPETTDNDVLFCSGGSDGFLNIWSKNGLEFQIRRQEENESLNCLLQMDNLLITGSNSNYILVYEINVLLYKTLLVCHRDSLRVLCRISPSLFLSGSLDGVIRIWETSNLLPHVTLENPKEYMEVSSEVKCFSCPVLAVAVLFEGFVVAGIGKNFKVYYVHTGQCVLEKVEAHTADITEIISLNRSEFITASTDATIKIWTILTFDRTASRMELVQNVQASNISRAARVKLTEHLAGHSSAIRKICALTESTFVSGGADSQLILWKDPSDPIFCVSQRGDNGSIFRKSDESKVIVFTTNFAVYDDYEPDEYHRESVGFEKYNISEPVLEFVKGLTEGKKV